MNPYRTFAKLGIVNSLDATLTKKDGTVLRFYVKPETLGAETLEGEYANAVGVRTWSTNYQSFIDDAAGEARWPEAGDVLTIKLDDGSFKSFSATRSTSTARYWDWLFTRPGYRVKFYTKYEGFEPLPEEGAENGGE